MPNHFLSTENITRSVARVSPKPGGSIFIVTENCFKLMQALCTLGEGMRSSRVSAFRDSIQQCGFRENKLLAQASPWLSSQRAHLQCRRHRRCGFNPQVRKIPCREGMGIHSTILAWRIPGTEEPGRLQAMGSQRIRCNWNNSAQLKIGFVILHLTFRCSDCIYFP